MSGSQPSQRASEGTLVDVKSESTKLFNNDHLRNPGLNGYLDIHEDFAQNRGLRTFRVIRSQRSKPVCCLGNIHPSSPVKELFVSREKATLLPFFLLPLKPFIAVLSEGTVGDRTVAAKFVEFLLKWSQRCAGNDTCCT